MIDREKSRLLSVFFFTFPTCGCAGRVIGTRPKSYLGQGLICQIKFPKIGEAVGLAADFRAPPKLYPVTRAISSVRSLGPRAMFKR